MIDKHWTTAMRSTRPLNWLSDQQFCWEREMKFVKVCEDWVVEETQSYALVEHTIQGGSIDLLARSDLGVRPDLPWQRCNAMGCQSPSFTVTERVRLEPGPHLHLTTSGNQNLNTRTSQPLPQRGGQPRGLLHRPCQTQERCGLPACQWGQVLYWQREYVTSQF